MFLDHLSQPKISTAKENDLVLDCFSGSGTTGEVSLELRRRYVGYEINSKFVQLSELRLSHLIERERILKLTNTIPY